MPNQEELWLQHTTYGKFCFTVMPFGLRNAPTTFQRVIDGLLLSHTDYTSVYIDDIAVFRNTWEEHKHHLTTVFNILRNAGLTIQAAKAQLTTTSSVFLGHRVGGGYISLHEAKISAVQDFIQPRFKKEVRAFIGLINHYRRFIPHISTLSTSLTHLLQLHKPDPVD